MKHARLRERRKQRHNNRHRLNTTLGRICFRRKLRDRWRALGRAEARELRRTFEQRMREYDADAV